MFDCEEQKFGNMTTKSTLGVSIVFALNGG